MSGAARRVRLSCGGESYEWVENWARIPDLSTVGWAHHGIASTGKGRLVSFHPSNTNLLIFDGDGELVDSHPTGLVEGHGITWTSERGEEYVWIADNGSKRQPALNYEYPPDAPRTSGRVVKMNLQGQTVMRLGTPELEAYRESRFAPTCVAVDEERFGGDGRLWVADGYGASLVHRFDEHGTYVSSLDGSEGAGRFDTPHAVFVDRRRKSPELYVADRGNRRVQVYDLDGRFLRAFGSEFLTSPSNFTVDGERMIIAELRARLAVVDLNDELIGYLGENEEVCKTEGWPNRRDANGRVRASDLLQAGKFNSPHGLTVDEDGNIYVAEWLIGERTIKLVKSRS